MGVCDNVRQVDGPFLGLTYQSAPTRLHSIHPLVKLALLTGFSPVVFLLAHWVPSLVLLAVLLGVYHFGGLGLSFFWTKLRAILVFGTLIILVQLLWCHEGFVLIRLGVLGLNLRLWSGGVTRGLVMALRFLNIIAASYAFVATTDPNRLAYSLMQVLVTALRFIPVFQHELDQIRNAQQAKGIRLQGLSISGFARFVRYLVLPLVVSALARVDTLTLSMEARGFGLHRNRTYRIQSSFTSVDKLVLVAGGAVLVMVCLWWPLVQGVL